METSFAPSGAPRSIKRASLTHGCAMGHNLSALRACDRQTNLAGSGRLKLAPMGRWAGLCCAAPSGM
jgi:hypothetical protein